MDRRAFLKAVLGTAGAAMMAPLIPVLDEYPDFDETKRYGDYVTATDKLHFRSYERLDAAMEPLSEGVTPTGRRLICETQYDVELTRLFDRQIEVSIPATHRDQIEYVMNRPDGSNDPLTNCWQYGWKYTPKV